MELVWPIASFLLQDTNESEEQTDIFLSRLICFGRPFSRWDDLHPFILPVNYENNETLFIMDVTSVKRGWNDFFCRKKSLCLRGPGLGPCKAF